MLVATQLLYDIGQALTLSLQVKVLNCAETTMGQLGGQAIQSDDERMV